MPGRLEPLGAGGRAYLVDGGHNPAAARTVARALALDGEAAARCGLAWRCVDDDTLMATDAFILEAARRLAGRYPDKPIYVTSSGQKKHMEAAKAFLEPRGIPTFPLIEDPFEVLSIAAKCRKAMERP